MLRRLTHAGIAFATTVVIYQVYVLLAVPFLEPIPQGPELIPATIDSDLAQASLPTHKHRDLLAHYFPADHWSLQQPPISFDNEQAMIVLDGYRPSEDGQVRVGKCVLLFFPNERIPGETPPNDAVILEAPHGALLQLDEGFQAGLGGFGRLQWARLEGDIIVRSDMRDAGSQDDLLLRTRDLYMNQDLIRTDAPVEMQLGQHWGRGKKLEIRLVAIERGEVGSSGLDIGGIDSIEIVENIEAQVTLQDGDLFGGKIPAGEMPPLGITSQGRFKFDFSSNLASFLDHVCVLQEYSNGLRNQLKCDALNLFFATLDESVVVSHGNESATTSVAGRTRTIGTLHPGTIEAIGTDLNPVEVTADTHDAHVVCGQMRIEIGPQRVTFSGQDEIILTYQGSEVHAPMVQYQAPPANSGYRIGTLLAAGNGWLKALPLEGKDAHPFEVSWTDRLELRRVQGRPVLSAQGRPRLTMVGGQLWADQLQLILRERAWDGSEDTLLPAEIAPERMVATGRVNLESAELSGKMNHLMIDVQYLPSDLARGNAEQFSQSSLLNGGAVGGRSYHIDSEQLTVEVNVRDGRPAVSGIDAHGELTFRESSVGGETSQPLVVSGDELLVRNADTPAAQISLRGKPATVTSAGMSIQAVELQMNRGTSGALIDAPGQLMIPMQRDLQGNLLAQPETLEINWQGGMTLENDRVTIRGDVIARTSSGQLNTNRLVAVLSAPLSFDGTTQPQETSLAQIECWEGVTAQFVQRDAVGTSSVSKMKLQSIMANQLTGQIQGVGPGWLESVHLATSSQSSPAPFNDVTPSADFTAVGASLASQHLRCLRVEFARGLEGNLHQTNLRSRHIAAVGDVHAVYGPVDSFEQTLNTRLQGDPAPETIYIEGQRLQVAESPNARLNPGSRLSAVELEATGGVVIEGLAGNQGRFTARAHIAKYDQMKTQFVLQWDGVRPATLTREKYPGAQRDEQPFQTLYYNHVTDELRMTASGIGKINLSPP